MKKINLFNKTEQGSNANASLPPSPYIMQNPQNTGDKISNRRSTFRKPIIKNPLALGAIILILILIGTLVIINIPSSENTSDINRVHMADLSGMTQSEILEWCAKNGINCSIKRDFKDDTKKGEYIGQSVPSGSTINKGDNVDVTISFGPQPGPGRYKEAIEAVEIYADRDHMSEKYALTFLSPEYNEEVTRWAVENANIDWYTMALGRASDYYHGTAYESNESRTLPQLKTRTRIRAALQADGFTKSQIDYAIDFISASVKEEVQN